MFKNILILVLLSNYSFSGYYYLPCEPSIANNLPLLTSKITQKSAEVQQKANSLKNRYEYYLEKLKEYNLHLTSYKILQDEKNMLLLDSKYRLEQIKQIYFYEVEK